MHETSQLTPRVRRVVDLVGEGLSNKEVAAQLFITLSTVEQHLNKARKILGLTSREELKEWSKKAKET